MRSEEYVRLLSVLRYQQGALHGEPESWYANGQLAIQQSYRDEQPDGVARYFSEEGALIRKEQWSHGQLHGECRSF